MDLVDNLLEVAADQRLEQVDEPRVEADGVEHRLVIRRPLHHPDDAFAPRPRDIVEEVAVAEASAVRDALGVKLVGRGRDLADLIGTEKAANDGITVAPIMREIGLDRGRDFASKRLRRTHD